MLKIVTITKMITMRAVIYARYSDPNQRETSIDDQVRICSKYAEREGIAISHTYHDKAITGAVKARPGYQKMLEDAAAGLFDILLVHDLSRLSRDDYEMKGVLRKFLWQNLRVIGVADGYDSARKGHKIHAGFKGLMNEMHLDDIRAWTHKAMAGKAEEGYNCGGRTYGYRNIPIEDPTGKKDSYGRPAIIAVRYEIDQEQSAVVRQIHEWYAAGYSYKWIATELNGQRIPSSRGSTWALTAIKTILENEMYQGTLMWNRRAWMKHPDSGKRTYKERPREEWIIKEMPELRIVPREIIDAVRRRQQKNKDAYSGMAITPLSQRYLFSGVLMCAECGGSFTVTAMGRYGCSIHKNRGPHACANSVTVSRHIVEERLLAGIKGQLLAPASFEKFKRAAVRALEHHNLADQKHTLQKQLKNAERERDNILAAIKAGIVTSGTKNALQGAENDIEDITQQLRAAERINLSGILPRAAERYQQAVDGLSKEFNDHVGQAREIIKSLVGERIKIHRRGDHLEAELQHDMTAIFARLVGGHFDSFGCGGRICSESNFISLEPRLRDNTPLAKRKKFLIINK